LCLPLVLAPPRLIPADQSRLHHMLAPSQIASHVCSPRLAHLCFLIPPWPHPVSLPPRLDLPGQPGLVLCASVPPVLVTLCSISYNLLQFTICTQTVCVLLCLTSLVFVSALVPEPRSSHRVNPAVGSFDVAQLPRCFTPQCPPRFALPGSPPVASATPLSHTPRLDHPIEPVL
jgi:hypothetical protein